MVSVAKVWKNGVSTSLTNGTQAASAISVFVNGADVYVAGYEINGRIYVAKYWKNGVATSLSDGSIDEWAQKMYVAGADVYVSGAMLSTISKAKTCKNDVVTTLTDGLNNAGMFSVFVK